MSGKRERGISYTPTVKLNAVNDTVCGGASSQGTGATLYGGILGIEVELTDDQVYYDSTVGTLYGGVYKYVKVLSTGGAGARGHVAFWSDADNYVVTATASNGNQAGIFLRTVTAGNFCWIQVGGLASVIFAAQLSNDTPAIKNFVVCTSGASTADALTDATTITADLAKRTLGIAEQAPTPGSINLVELLDRFSSPFK